jgi:flagellar protein FlgJ
MRRAGVAGAKQQKRNTGTDKAALNKACQDFESLLVHQMLKQMRQTVPKSGFLDGGSAEQIYHSMLDGELAKQIAQQKGIGLAPMIYRQMASLAQQDDETGQNPLKSNKKVPIE